MSTAFPIAVSAAASFAVYMLAALLFPPSQWSILALGRKAPQPYVDVPWRLWKENGRSFFSTEYVAGSAVISIAGPCIGLTFSDNIFAVILSCAVMLVPFVVVHTRLMKVWRDFTKTETN